MKGKSGILQSRVCCPRCGELLEIKADDEEITCPYCGCGIISKRESCGQDRIVESAQLSENDRAADGSRHLFYLIHIIGCLLAGSLIYFSFRPQAQISAFLQNLFDYRPDPDWLQMTKEVGIFRFINNYVPDILWAAALSFAMVCLLGEGTRNYLFAAGLCVSAEAGVELMQKAGLLRGTFDLWDIVSEIITTGFVLLIIIYHWKWRIKHEENRSKNSQSAACTGTVCADGGSERVVGNERNKVN